MTQKELEKWMQGCIDYFNKHSNNNMKTVEERIKQLEQAHGRLFNQYTEKIDEFEKLIYQLKKKVDTLTPVEEKEIEELPEKLIQGKIYQATITDIIDKKDNKYYKLKYRNWEIKLKGKEHIFLAFIPADVILEPGMQVRFEYEHYLKCKYLKVC